MSTRIAVVGGGLAGLTAAWQMHRLGLTPTLFEASSRLGGTVETVQEQGFTVELGPDGWVTEKPFAAGLARELGLGEELRPSLDAGRVTYIVSGGRLLAMPDGMRMMVPSDLQALEASPLFSAEARAAYAAEITRAEELRARAPHHDESVGSFVERHFGAEVLEKLAAPLLSGVFGGDVAKLSVRAVMPNFVRMEREHGSLILALQANQRRERAAGHSIFTTLRRGTGSLVEALQQQLPPGVVRLNRRVLQVARQDSGWMVSVEGEETQRFDELVLATPAHITRELLASWPEVAHLLEMDATSAVIVAFGFGEHFTLPQGFGFLVPFTEPSPLLACTFTDQKFAGRVPEGGRLLRAFFGGQDAPGIAARSDEAIATLALHELQKIVGPLPRPLFRMVRRWPRSLPQYAVGHGERVSELMHRVQRIGGLYLLGNAYHGVGLPDLVREARALAHRLAAQ